MLNNKADFVLKYNEIINTNLKKDGIDWSQSKVIFISPSFSKYQQQAIDFKDLPIELWEVKKYASNLIQYMQLKSNEISESINIIKSSEIINSVKKEIKVYTEEDHLKNANKNILSLYEELKNQILNLGNDIKIIPQKQYIAFKASYNFIDIVIQKNKIKCFLNMQKGTLNDPYNISRDVSNIGHWGNGDYEFYIQSTSDFINIMPLIKQSYDKNK